MSNILTSSNSLVLIGVGILAVLIIFLAVWLARVNSRASKERAKVEALEQRLAHVESYLSRTSQLEAAVADDVQSAKTRPVGSRKAPAGAAEKASEKPRRSKKQPVIPYGRAKASADEVYSGQRPAAASASGELRRPPELERQSVTRDARRRREERRQEELRRQAQSIVQEMQQPSAGRTRPSARGSQRRSQ